MKNAANALLNRVEFPVLLAGLVIAPAFGDSRS